MTKATKKLQKNLISLMKIFASLSQENLVAEKTNTLMHILWQPLVYYDKIYIFSPNLHQEKIQNFKDIMDSISKKVGYPVLEINGPDEIKNTNEYFSDNRKIVVFDDVINAPEKIKN